MGAALSLLLVLSGAVAVQAENSGPRRVILIQADDLGCDDLGAFGNPLVRTPHLDRLARESVQAIDFTVNPVCAPSRATLLTGRHFLRTGVSHVHGGKDYLHPAERTLADVFRAAGWQTAMWGKWHLGTGPGYEPWERGFQTAERSQLYRHHEAVLTGPGGRRETGAWADVVLIDEAIQFLTAHPQERAFLYLASMTPHAPVRAPEALKASFRAAGVPDGLAELHAMVSLLDEQVGRLLGFLEARGMTEDTLLVFTSDNGPAISRGELTDEDRHLRKVGGHRGWKGDLWQGGVRAPLFLRSPAGLRPGVVTTPLDQADLFPTILAWCGLTAENRPYPIDGHDVGAILAGAGRESGVDRPIFNYAHPGWLTSRRSYSPRGLPGEYNPVAPDERKRLDPAAMSMSVRRGRHKLLRNPDAPDAEGGRARRSVLIDLYEDPGEADDVSTEHPEVKRRLEAELDAWFAGIATSPHAFSAPVHRVSPAGATLPARTPAQLGGPMQNTVSVLEGWMTRECVATYNLEAVQAVDCRVALEWKTPPPPGQVVAVMVEGGNPAGVLLRGPDWRSDAVVPVPGGASSLVLRAMEVVEGVPGALHAVQLLRAGD